MEYHVDGSANLLYNNQAEIEAYAPGKALAEPDKWHNYGGDKVWFWPQDDWSRILHRGWPPQHQLDGIPWAAKVLDSGIELTSEPVPEYGATAQRTIHLEASGALRQVIEVRPTVAVKGGKALEVRPLAAWTVSQVKQPTEVVMDAYALKPLNGLGWRTMTPVAEHKQTRLLVDAGKSQKISGAGRFLQAHYSTGVLTQNIVSMSEGDGDSRERLQVYSTDVGQGGKADDEMVELELTSPLAVPTNDKPVRLEVLWAFAPAAPMAARLPGTMTPEEPKAMTPAASTPVMPPMAVPAVAQPAGTAGPSVFQIK